MVTLPQTVDPILLPPEIEELAVAYLTDALDPYPVATKLPEQFTDSDVEAGMLRVEAGGGTRPNRFQFDVTCLLHGYSRDENVANELANKAVALMAAGRGQTVGGWYVV